MIGSTAPSALRLVTVAAPGEVRLGVLDGDHVIDLNRVDPALPVSLYDLIVAGDAALDAARGAAERVRRQYPSRCAELMRDAIVYRLEDVRLLAPLPAPRRNVFCVGRNYLKHAAEGARARGEEFTPPEYPEFFTKPPAAVVGTDARFPIDARVTERLDYEAELAVVIGRRGRDIPREAASGHVFGYTLANDLSARDQQRRHGQWFKGKALDGSCPIGPVVVPRADVPDPHALTLSLRVNGETRQHGSTAEMTWPVPDILYWLSQGTTLEPGDLILTGTPAGVGNAMRPPEYLRPGDIVEAEIDGFGTLRTYIVAAATR